MPCWCGLKNKWQSEFELNELRRQSITAKTNIRRNQEIRAPRVRLIGADGAQIGIVSLAEALRIAEQAGLDLVEIAPQADPPVCRVMDYGKFRFEQDKKLQAAKKKQKQIQVKEIKLRPGTGESDYQTKLRSLIRFLEDGDKAKVTVRFRGREVAHAELGMELLARVEKDLSDYAVVEQPPKMEGKQLVMVLAPKKK
jgi:translation initiation factor IF-3